MRIGILGTGNMGKAIAAGLVASYGREVSLCAFDRNQLASQGLPEGVRILPAQSWAVDPQFPEIVIISTKPQDVAASLELWRRSPVAGFDPLWISIAAGIALDDLGGMLYPGARVCRVMPNTPALVQHAFSAFCPGEGCSEHDVALVEKILNAFGTCVRVPEKLMNAVTGLSGSGPAYVYLFIEALIEAGITAGLPYATARLAAVHTVIGATLMVEKTGKTPAELKVEVMSPGGTTVRGLAALEEGGVKSSIIKAVIAATARAEELGRRPA